MTPRLLRRSIEDYTLEDEGVIIERQNQGHITVPIGVVAAWENTYGREDVVNTFPKIQSAVETIDKLLSKKSLMQSEIPMKLAGQIQNPNFFCTDFGKIVQAGVLVGYKIDPAKFFQESKAFCDPLKQFGVSVIEVSVLDKAESHKGWSVHMEVCHRGESFSLVKSTTDILELLYETNVDSPEIKDFRKYSIKKPEE